MLIEVKEITVVRLAVVTVLVVIYPRLLDIQLYSEEVVTFHPAEVTVLIVVVISVSLLEGLHNF